MITLGSLTFDSVEGFVPALTATRTEVIDNPALVAARLVLPLPPQAELYYQGFQPASIRAAVDALAGSVVIASYQGGSASVFVDAVVQHTERAALLGGTLGRWCELRVRVTPWA